MVRARIGRLQEKWVVNPTFQQLEFSDMDIIVAGSKDSIAMVEGGALEIGDDDVLEGLSIAHSSIRSSVRSRFLKSSDA